MFEKKKSEDPELFRIGENTVCYHSIFLEVKLLVSLSSYSKKQKKKKGA